MASSRMLIVEGSDDVDVCSHLLTKHKIPNFPHNTVGNKNDIEILDAKGVNKLLDQFRTYFTFNENLEYLGIVLDIDTPSQGKRKNYWESLRNRLAKQGYQRLPKFPKAEGTVIQQPDLPTVGIWLMPNNQQDGMLENFIQSLIKADDPLWLQAVQAVASLTSESRLFRPQHQTKAEVRTWLAWQRDPGQSMGLAITKRYVDPNAPTALHFIKWLRVLFDLPESH